MRHLLQISWYCSRRARYIIGDYYPRGNKWSSARFISVRFIARKIKILDIFLQQQQQQPKGTLEFSCPIKPSAWPYCVCVFSFYKIN